MANDLRILITGALNSVTSLSEINKGIEQLQGKINKLNLSVKIDQNVLNVLKNFSTQMEKIASVARNTGKVIQESINPDGSRIKTTYYNGLKGEFSQVETAAKQTGNTVTKSAEEQQQAINKLTQSYQNLTRVSKSYNEQAQLTRNTQTYQNGNNTLNVNNTSTGTTYRETLNPAKDLQDTQKLISEKERLRQELVSLGQTGNVTSQQLAQVARTVNSAGDTTGIQQARQAYAQLADNAKLAEQMAQGRERAALASRQAESKLNSVQAQQVSKNQEITKQIEQQLALYQRQAEIQATALMNNPNKALSAEQQMALQTYLTNVRGLNAEMPNLTQRQRELSLDFREVSANAQTAAMHTHTFGDMLSQAFTKFPIWINNLLFRINPSNSVKLLFRTIPSEAHIGNV
jgi:hypothetical protein